MLLGDSQESGVLHHTADLQQCHGHDGFLNGFHTGGAVLIVGGAFLHTPEGTPEDPEAQADDRFGFVENLQDRLVLKPANAAEAHIVRTVLFCHADDFFSQFLAHRMTPFSFRC